MLTALSLYNLVLDPARADYDVLDFIVPHKTTLTPFELDECSVYGGETGMYQRSWHAVLRRFQQELSSLRSFLLTADEYDEWMDRPKRVSNAADRPIRYAARLAAIRPWY